jgi:hypothetical protein
MLIVWLASRFALRFSTDSKLCTLTSKQTGPFATPRCWARSGSSS